MAGMTATRKQTVPPRPGQPQPAAATWPLRARLDLGAVPTAPGCGRAWTRAILWEWRLARLPDQAELITSELVTNALLASRWLDRPAIGLTLLSDGQQLVILVRDFNPGIPVPRHASAEEESGRGLMLVEAISDRFGWERPADGTPGKIVWAVLLLSAGHSDRDHPVDQMREGTPAEMTSPPRDSYTARWRAAGRQEARELAPGWLASSSALPSRLVQSGVRAAAWVPADGVTLRRVRAALGRL
jgi:anti-sigma regulatory factor (Ser/Thr protein kinase)